MLFNKLKNKLSGSVNKYAGKTDFLEAVCASAALVAAADGDIKEDEIKTTVAVVSSNPTLLAAFKPTAIEKTVETMLTRAKAGMTGRIGLYKEIEQVASDNEMAETVFLCAMDVAAADGEVGDKEQKVLNEVAKRLGLNASNYTNV